MPWSLSQLLHFIHERERNEIYERNYRITFNFTLDSKYGIAWHVLTKSCQSDDWVRTQCFCELFHKYLYNWRNSESKIANFRVGFGISSTRSPLGYRACTPLHSHVPFVLVINKLVIERQKDQIKCFQMNLAKIS